jgi:hypothetical protein
MSPTRESTESLTQLFNEKRSKTAVAVSAVGGTDVNQNIDQLRKGCDYVIGTPGRLAFLHNSNHLVTHSLGAVVLDEADKLLSSPVVLDFMKACVRDTTQRIFVAEAMDKWLNDTLTDAGRRGFSLEKLDFPKSTTEKDTPPSLIHKYTKTTAGDEGQHLRHLIDSFAKSVIFCRSAADVFIIVGDARFADLIALTPDMTERVRGDQLTKFKTAKRAILISCDNSLPSSQTMSDVDQVLNLGLPARPHTYMDRIKVASPSVHVVSLVRSNQTDLLSKLRVKTGIKLHAASIENAEDLTVSFAKSMKELPMAIPTWISQESEKLVKLYGANFVGAILKLAECRKALFEKRSPLSGFTGYTPVLLLDPFMKKVRNYETAEKLVCGCFKRSEKPKIGRIALSAKGYIVDVPSGVVAQVAGSKRLRERNIKAIVVNELPQLVQSDRLFSLSRSRRDKNQLLRSLKPRKKI